MKRRAQQGLLLVPVALVLAVAGALSWMAVRDSAMRVSAIDAEYDTEVARYLAEAGANLVAWQNERLGCGCAGSFNTISLPGGSVTLRSVVAESGGVRVDVSAATPRGAARRITRAMPVYDITRRDNRTMSGKDYVDDTFIKVGDNTEYGSLKYIELTDGVSRGMIVFTRHKDIPPLSLAVFAELRLKQIATKSTAPTQLVYLHRMTSKWTELGTDWFSKWNTPGGDFVAEPFAVLPVGTRNDTYETRMDGIVDGWFQQRTPNMGILLMPSGLQQAQLGSWEKGADGPKLYVEYHKRCP